jgi:glycosyltransferase involved in cell wall biosynthesis
LSRILVLSSTPSPFLEDHGGKQRLVRLLKSLSKRHSVTLLSLSWEGKDSSVLISDSLMHISIPVEPEVVRASRGRTTLRKPNNDTRIAYFKRYFKTYRAKITELAKVHDIIVVDHYATAPLINGLKNIDIPVFYSSQNCETDLAKQMFPKNSDDIKLINETEKTIIDNASAISYCSKDDFAIMKSYFIIDKPTYYIPNGNDLVVGRKAGAGASSKNIVFIGSGHPPNTIAAQRVLDLAWLVPEYTFVIAGSCVGGIDHIPVPKNVVKINSISNDEVEKMFSDAFAFINPMKTGSGTHLKMMKALSYGLPIISSTVGARGFSNSEKDSCMIIAEELSDMADAVKSLTDAKTYKGMSTNSLELSKEYDWKKIGDLFTKAIEDTIAKKKVEQPVIDTKPVNNSLKKDRVLVYSIIRNENKYMNSYHNKLIQMVDSFPQYEFYLSIYENDSTDGTKQKIMAKDWSMFAGVSIISEDIATQDYGSVKDETRVKNLSIARNKAIEAGGFLSFVDYVMMIESDMEFDMKTVDKILNFKNVVPDFDIVSGITIRNKRLYDQWATRHKPEYDEGIYPIADDYKIKSYDKYYSTSNGICLYRAEPFREGVRYGYVNTVTGEFDCDTVVVCQNFHELGYHNVYIIHDAEIYHEHR